ncbi:MAG TPA: nucleoside deaminase, partial [Desulfomonilia bacterium]|nr:nucleoside deaminase [Desulfomonilia bacterium]
ATGMGEVPIGAVLVVDDHLVRGHNRVIRDNDPTAHAEIVVIREAARLIHNYRLPHARLYVTIEPCIMCVGAVIQARIEYLTYGARDKRYGAVESMMEGFKLDVNHKPNIQAGLLEDQAGSLIKAFFQAKR